MSGKHGIVQDAALWYASPSKKVIVNIDSIIAMGKGRRIDLFGSSDLGLGVTSHCSG
jgi:hypothetical protein